MFKNVATKNEYMPRKNQVRVCGNEDRIEYVEQLCSKFISTTVGLGVRITICEQMKARALDRVFYDDEEACQQRIKFESDPDPPPFWEHGQILSDPKWGKWKVQLHPENERKQVS